MMNLSPGRRTVPRENRKPFLPDGGTDHPVEPNMVTPDPTTRTSALRTALRRLVLGAFGGVALVIVLLVGEAVLSAAGLSSDPHGYGVFAGVLFAVVLTPVALVLWLLYRSMRRRGN